jgi:uncharacterized protein (TIGR02118 family)
MPSGLVKGGGVIKTILLNPALAAASPHGVGYATPAVDALRRLTISWPIEEDIKSLTVVPFKGVMECGWFADEASAVAAFGCASLDELATTGAGSRFVARENIVVPGPDSPFPAAGVKFIAFFKRRAGMSVAEFQRYWRTEHAEIVKGTPKLRRYVQSHLVTEHYGAGADPIADGTAELWWDSLEHYRESWASHSMQVEQYEDSLKFCGPGPYICILKEATIPLPARAS